MLSAEVVFDIVLGFLKAGDLARLDDLGQNDVVRVLEEENLRDSVKIMFGGAPVTDEWIAECGADGTAENAAEAARVALKLMA